MGVGGMDRSEAIRAQIKAILVEALVLNIEPTRIGDNEILFDGYLGVDSVAAIEILAHLEDVFEIEIEDQDIDLAFFKTVDSLAKVVERHIAKQDVEGTGG